MTPPLGEQRGAVRKAASCASDLAQKSLQSLCPLSLSPVILNDPISTGKRGNSMSERDEGCGDSPELTKRQVWMCWLVEVTVSIVGEEDLN